MITRRHMIGAIGGGVIASAVAAPGLAAGVGAGDPMFRAVCDLKLAGGRALRDAARAAGCSAVDPEGEIVRLFHGQAAPWLHGGVPLVGYTNWSDFHMMGEIARPAGLRIAQAAMVGAAGTCRELVLPRGDALTARMRRLLEATAQACGDSGIIWIVQT